VPTCPIFGDEYEFLDYTGTDVAAGGSEDRVVAGGIAFVNCPPGKWLVIKFFAIVLVMRSSGFEQVTNYMGEVKKTITKLGNEQLCKI